MVDRKFIPLAALIDHFGAELASVVRVPPAYGLHEDGDDEGMVVGDETRRPVAISAILALTVCNPTALDAARRIEAVIAASAEEGQE